MKKIHFIICALTLFANTLMGQTLKRLPSGIEYKLLKVGKVVKKPKVGYLINTIIEGRCSGHVLFTTANMAKGQPVNFTVQKPQFRGDVMEGIMQMNEGDSAIFYIPADSFFRQGKPPYYKLGDKVIYNVKLNWAKSPAEIEKIKKDQIIADKQQKEYQKKIAKMMAEQKANQEKMKRQVFVDDGLIAKYIAQKGLTNVQKTKEGLRYIITKEGEGDLIKKGKQVVMNYTGKLLNDSTFDSNEDSTFGHKQPFMFPLGQGRVIQGWDQGIQLLKKGSKAKFIIPSGLAYGPGSQGKIPAFSVLTFDVEVVDVLDAPPPPTPTPPTAPASIPPTNSPSTGPKPLDTPSSNLQNMPINSAPPVQLTDSIKK